jgi:hypothetical protein
MTELEEERLAELIAVLPPAPPAWVEAATELPHARAAIEELAARAAADRDARARDGLPATGRPLGSETCAGCWARWRCP